MISRYIRLIEGYTKNEASRYARKSTFINILLCKFNTPPIINKLERNSEKRITPITLINTDEEERLEEVVARIMGGKI
ncbi:hypothetical protein DJ524_09990 [Sulfolobus sp. D5]|nr:hypothetical protein DJ524_09990 [Sulfolobus sp. D5]